MDIVQILDEYACIEYSSNNSDKGMNSIILPLLIRENSRSDKAV